MRPRHPLLRVTAPRRSIELLPERPPGSTPARRASPCQRACPRRPQRSQHCNSLPPPSSLLSPPLRKRAPAVPACRRGLTWRQGQPGAAGVRRGAGSSPRRRRRRAAAAADAVPRDEPQLAAVLEKHVAGGLLRVDAHAVCRGGGVGGSQGAGVGSGGALWLAAVGAAPSGAAGGAAARRQRCISSRHQQAAAHRW